MSVPKFKIGDRVKIVQCSNQAWWYSERHDNKVGQEFTIGEVRHRVDGWNYAFGEASQFVLEGDIVLASLTNPTTLLGIQERLAELDKEEDTLKEALESVNMRRESLKEHLLQHGLVLSEEKTSEAPTVKRNLVDMYEQGLVKEGQLFRALKSAGSAWKTNEVCEILQVDDDGSVKISSDNVDYQWVFTDESMKHFEEA